MSRRGFLKIVTRLLPVMLILEPAGCSAGRKKAGYGSGKYGARKYG